MEWYYTEETQKNIYKLKNGGFWDEWGMVDILKTFIPEMGGNYEN